MPFDFYGMIMVQVWNNGLLHICLGASGMLQAAHTHYSIPLLILTSVR